MSTPAALEGLCDEALISVIVEGNYSPALRAIGAANVPTLHRAVESLNVAAVSARSGGDKDAHYKERALLCRTRIRLAQERANASF